MARACPACERPNADSAVKCLYCSAPLPAVAPPEPTSTTAPAPATDTGPGPVRKRYLVILFPPPAADATEPPEALVAAFSRITALGLYESRQRLLSRRPRAFRRIDDEGAARALSSELAEAGVPHYVVEESSMLALPISRARSIAFHERHLQVALELGQASFSVRHDELLLVVRGDITRERHHEERLGSSQGVSHRLTPEQRLHLYAREATVGIEVEPDSFDWDMLGHERTNSSVLNARRFVAMLSSATSAVVDLGFDDEPVVLSRSGRGEDPSRALAAGERGPGGIVWDNEEQFHYYSRWRYRLERHLAKRAASPGRSEPV